MLRRIFLPLLTGDASTAMYIIEHRRDLNPTNEGRWKECWTMTADVDEEGETELSPCPPWRKQQGAEEGKKTSAQE
jgi:hypothetical protein